MDVKKVLGTAGLGLELPVVRRGLGLEARVLVNIPSH